MDTPDRLTPYQRRLFVFLSVATFFEGYDMLALTQILPNLRADLRLDERDAGFLLMFINVGTVVAYLLIRRADRWGRRRVLTITIAGYTVFTFLTGLSTGVYTFALCQMVARIFLIGEWAISMVIAAEEFPAARRGMVIGVVSAFASLGSVFCAGVVPMLLKTAYGWRSVYLVGIVPLVILGFARRGLRETRRFEAQVARPAARPLAYILSTPYRRRVLELAAIWFLTYLCTQNGVTFWKEFAVHERGMTDAQVGAAISVAAVAATPLVFFAGRLLDLIGRRGGAAVMFLVLSCGIFACYTLHGRAALTVALTLGIFGVSAVLPVLNAFTTELFPTDLRGDAFAWANNLLGRVGYVLSPALVGVVARQYGWGAAVRATTVFPLVALALIFLLLPETNRKELEETAAVH